MAKSTYPLQTVRKLREDELEAAKEAFAQAIHRLNEARTQAEHARQQVQLFDQQTQKLRQMQFQSAPGKIADVRMQQAYLKRREGERGQLLDVVASADRMVELCERALQLTRDQVTNAQKEYKAVEKHFEKWEQARKEQAARALDAENDELASQQYIRRKS